MAPCAIFAVSSCLSLSFICVFIIFIFFASVVFMSVIVCLSFCY